MDKLIKFPAKHLRAVKNRGERKRPRPRKKMVEVTVYDCPECGTELEKPKDPDVRATMAFYCPNCHYCF
jgi:DNA-directed RNA polymerase subunit RPC12/RpoP